MDTSTSSIPPAVSSSTSCAMHATRQSLSMGCGRLQSATGEEAATPTRSTSPLAPMMRTMDCSAASLRNKQRRSPVRRGPLREQGPFVSRSIFEEPLNLRPVFFHNELGPKGSSTRQQFELCSGATGESLDRAPRDIGIILGVKHHDL